MRRADEPFDLDMVIRSSTALDWLSGSDHAVHWVEPAPESGNTVIASRAPTGRLTFSGSAEIGNSIHAYGGRPYVVTPPGTFATLAEDGQVWNLATGRRCSTGPLAHGDLSFGDGRVVGVRESSDGDELVIIEPASATTEVAHRADFIAAPHLRGGRLTWTQWTNDAMPWDSSEVWVAGYRPGLPLEDRQRIAGGPAESAHQPRWGPDGHLYLLSDRTDWWNLYRWSSDHLEAVAPMEAECGAALWEPGYASYTFLASGVIAVITQNGPVHRLVLVRPDGTVAELPTPYRSIKPFLAAASDRVAVIGGAPDRPQEVALVPTDGSEIEVVRGGRRPEPARISVPEILTVPSADETIIVVLYPAAGSVDAAPLIVRPHAGPTYNSELRLDWEVQFFTSRGFAVADVDYRGSTGYGRRFRKALDGRWGEVDVEDCFAAATELIQSGRARADAVFISGASAGGYTALRAVSRADTPFALAVARSAIVNPNRWMVTAPRFQRAHAAVLAHDAADVDPDQVVRPVVLIHGRNDPVAPIDDVDELAVTLHQRDRLVQFLALADVGHHLSSPEALRAALTAELGAYHHLMSDLG